MRTRKCATRWLVEISGCVTGLFLWQSNAHAWQFLDVLLFILHGRWWDSNRVIIDIKYDLNSNKSFNKDIQGPSGKVYWHVVIRLPICKLKTDIKNQFPWPIFIFSSVNDRNDSTNIIYDHVYHILISIFIIFQIWIEKNLCEYFKLCWSPNWTVSK